MNSVVRPIQRGLDNLLANWPLLLIRIVESIVVTMIVGISILAAIVVAGLGWAISAWRELASDPTRLAGWIVHHPLPLFLAIVVALLGTGVALVVHSFVFGGLVGSWIDGDRAGGVEPQTRRAFARFSADRWLAHSQRAFLPVFIIYNVTWGLFSLVLVVPLAATLVVTLMLGTSSAIIPVTCGGLALTVILAFFLSIFTHVWTVIAVALSTGGKGEVRQPLRDAFRLMAQRAAPVLVLLVMMTVIGFAVSGMSLGLNLSSGIFRHSPGAGVALLPFDLFLSAIQSAASAVVSSWMVTGFVAIVEEWRPASAR